VATGPVAADGGKIGDTTAFGIRIVGFNAMRDRATYLLDVPAYVVALVVIPGQTVEIVGRHLVGDTVMRTSGLNEVTVAMPRPTGVTPLEQPRLAERLDFQKCVDRHVRARTRRTKTTKTVRDSTGKAVEVQIEDVDVPLDAEREAERRCGGILTRQGPDAMPEPNRYLVVLASQAQLTPAELHARLDAMTVTASDLRSTVDGIGEALYFDRRAIWSGHYTRW
jgi:hypothetical protein